MEILKRADGSGHKPQHSSGIADNDGQRWHIASHDGTCANKRKLPNRHARQNSGTGSDRCTPLNPHTLEKEPVVPAARVSIVRECAVRTQVHIWANPSAAPQVNTTLDCDTIPDDDTTLYEGVITQIAVGTNPSSSQNMAKGPDSGAGSHRGTLFHER